MNEIINIIPYFIAVLFSTIFYNLCYIQLNGFKINITLKKCIMIMITAILIFINNCYDNLWLKFVLTSLIFCISFKIIYEDKWKNIIFSYIIIYIVIILIEILLSNLLYKIGIVSSSNATISYSIIKIIFSVLISIIEYLLFKINCINKLLKKLINFFTNDINDFIIAYLLLITCAVLGILNIDYFAYNNSTQMILCLLIIFTILFVIAIKSKTTEEYLKESNKRLIEYNEKYGQFLDEYKIYKHNIKNKLVGMKAFGNKKINALIDDLLEEETNFSIKNNNLYNLPNGIKGIVAEKLYDQNLNVIITNKIKKDPFIRLSPKTFNSISECIGISLDNAIEASKETEDPTIIMDLYENNNEIYVKIGNNFCNNIDINKLGQKYYSTKNRGSGLGLFSIKHNKIVKGKISIINNIFYIELKIKKHD